MPLCDEFFENAKWKGQDDFPSSPEWKAEVEKWLLFLKKNNQLERYKSRLNSNPKQRDTYLAEIMSGYFIDELCGFRIIDWEPIYADKNELEFAIFSEEKELVLCEVKCPVWEREVVEEAEGKVDNNYPRLKKGKWVSGEARRLSPWKDIRNSVAKGYKKFPNDKPSLLIIKDDMFSSPITSPEQIGIALYCEKDDGYIGTQSYLSENGCFNSREFENLGGVLFLDVKITDTTYSVNYVSQLALNP